MHLLIWLVMAFLFALWSAAAWGLHVLLGLDPGQWGDVGPLLRDLPFGAVIDAWIPGWQALIAGLAELLRAALGWLGAWAPWIVATIWGIGTAMLLGLGLALSLIVRLIRRTTAPAAQPAA